MLFSWIGKIHENTPFICLVLAAFITYLSQTHSFQTQYVWSGDSVSVLTCIKMPLFYEGRLAYVS